MAARQRLLVDAPVGTAVQVGTVAVPLRPGRPAELPPRPRGFRGRDRELAAIVRAVGGPVRAVLLTGRPGGGRSALAVEAAHRLAPLFPDGVLVDELGGRSLQPAQLGGRLLSGLGLPAPTDPVAAHAALLEALSELRVLVVLDDLDDLRAPRGPGEGGSPDRPMLSGGARSFFVVTARSGLGVPRSMATRIRIGDLAPDDAAAMLGGPGPGVDELVEACGGLPLALRIAATRLAAEPGLTPGRLAALLREPSRGLAGLGMGERELRDSLQAATARLRPAERAMLRALGTRGPAEATVARAAELAGVTRGRAAAALDALADSHLIDRRPGRPARYALPAPVRRFAEEVSRDAAGYQDSSGSQAGSAAPSCPS